MPRSAALSERRYRSLPRHGRNQKSQAVQAVGDHDHASRQILTMPAVIASGVRRGRAGMLIVALIAVASYASAAAGSGGWDHSPPDLDGLTGTVVRIGCHARNQSEAADCQGQTPSVEG